MKSQVKTEDLSKSDDQNENVEFYENVENLEENKKENNKQCIGEGTSFNSSPNTISSVPIHHENDTDFEVSKTPQTSSSCTTEDSLPTIRRPKT